MFPTAMLVMTYSGEFLHLCIYLHLQKNLERISWKKLQRADSLLRQKHAVRTKAMAD